VATTPRTRNGAAPRFLSVPETAEVLGMSEVTLYRAIREGQFPAIKIRGRYVVPARALDDLESEALKSDGIAGAYTARAGAA
jgi:excisionase family DNA binding protein